MGYRSRKLDMAHALPAYACLRHFNAAAVADNALISDFLIFTAMTLPVFAGSENFLTEQAVLFRL